VVWKPLGTGATKGRGNLWGTAAEGSKTAKGGSGKGGGSDKGGGSG
tara:strand:+ start:1732 stop:1869 length:138 start_codon:yes stop_codon:yes gene_type:complete